MGTQLKSSLVSKLSFISFCARGTPKFTGGGALSGSTSDDSVGSLVSYDFQLGETAPKRENFCSSFFEIMSVSLVTNWSIMPEPDWIGNFEVFPVDERWAFDDVEGPLGFNDVDGCESILSWSEKGEYS